MKKFVFSLIVLSNCCLAQDPKHTSDAKSHFVCIQSNDTYHDRQGCASLNMCSGGKIRKTKNVEGLKPCSKCARVQQRHIASGFTDIKRILGVKDKKQIRDSLGTSAGTIQRPGGLSLRISGPPESRTVNTIEFFLSPPVAFIEDSIITQKFYDRLGLQFEGCKVDTIRNTTPHPVTNKIKKDVAIEYRGCAIVEPRDAYEDTSKYYYELLFIANDKEVTTELEKVQLTLRVDKE
jgi:hypothetical protein